MTLRAGIIGVLFALFISSVVYFNDQIIHQTILIGNHMPVIVFGFIILLVLFINPFFRLLGWSKSLTPREIAVICALGLVACGWPGAGFFRGFSAIVSMPASFSSTNSSWKATRIMSYTPGVSFEFAEGHIRDWKRLGDAFMASAKKKEPDILYRLYELLPPYVRETVMPAVQGGDFGGIEKEALLSGINAALNDPLFWNNAMVAHINPDSETRRLIEEAQNENAPKQERVRANRLLLAHFLPDIFVLPPRGNGVLLADGDMNSPAVINLLRGGADDSGYRIPWRTWLPTIFLWCGFAVLIGIASVCLVVIVQPQWKKELLPYPIARFFQELTRANSPGANPSVLRNKLFWYAFALLCVIHLVNGLYAWFPQSIHIPLSFDFTALKQLFPRARMAPFGNLILWQPTFFPTVIAIAFFIGTDVSFSLGFSGIMYMILFSFLVTRGIAVERDWLLSSNMNLMRFGSFAGIGIMLFYVGRHYYVKVIAGSLGMKSGGDTPRATIWATRMLYLCIIAGTVLLSRYDVEWFFGFSLILLVLLMLVVMTRINVETGAFFLQPYWTPLGVLMTLFGFEAIGPTAFIVMGILCMIFTGDPREIIMPYVANALYIANDSSEKKVPSRIAVISGIVIVAGLFTALAVTLFLQYRYGLDFQDTWSTRSLPSMTFNNASLLVSELTAYNELSSTVGASGLERLTLMRPHYINLLWLGFGLLLVFVASTLRLRFTWWPLHPVAFLVWGTFPAAYFSPSFIAGWALKTAIVKLGGARALRQVKPFMIGVIAGEFFSVIMWSLWGTIYHLTTNLSPVSYHIFPD